MGNLHLLIFSISYLSLKLCIVYPARLAERDSEGKLHIQYLWIIILKKKYLKLKRFVESVCVFVLELGLPSGVFRFADDINIGSKIISENHYSSTQNDPDQEFPTFYSTCLVSFESRIFN